MTINLIKLKVAKRMITVGMRIHDDQRHSTGNFIDQTFQITRAKTGIDQHGLLTAQN